MQIFGSEWRSFVLLPVVTMPVSTGITWDEY